MKTTPEAPPTPPLDYAAAEGLDASSDPRRDWTLVAIAVTALVAIMAVVVAIVAISTGRGDTVVRPAAKAAPAAPAADKPAPTLADAKGVAFEKFQRVDPTLPAVPPGAVKKFTVDVMQHVTQVSPDLAPTEVWTYVVNGKTYRGSAASAPIVVNQGDKVQVTLVNGGSKAMHVTMPHSIDFHSAEVAPSKYYVDVAAGKKLTFDFVAKHPGVYMYHCATQPVLSHTSNGMSGMMVVKPRHLPPVDRELWMTQSEYYLGAPGQPADMQKMQAEKPDVIAFNGFANQYKTAPIPVRRGERIRMYVLNAGPSVWSAFHVIGTVFDTTRVEGVTGHDSQTVNLAPSQGGWVEFTLDQEGNFPFVTHAFGDMVKGAAGMLHTANAPMPKAPAKPTAAVAGSAKLPVELGDMFVKPSTTTIKAGKMTFVARNTGQTTHELMVEKAPIKLDAPNQPNEGAALGMVDNLAPGGSGQLTLDMKPGTYELFCNMPGHYAAGQHTTLTVTGG